MPYLAGYMFFFSFFSRPGCRGATRASYEKNSAPQRGGWCSLLFPRLWSFFVPTFPRPFSKPFHFGKVVSHIDITVAIVQSPRSFTKVQRRRYLRVDNPRQAHVPLFHCPFRRCHELVFAKLTLTDIRVYLDGPCDLELEPVHVLDA